MIEMHCLWQEPALLGEGPTWVAREGALFWVDILGYKLHRLTLTNGRQDTWTYDAQITSFAARQSGGYVATIRDGFAFVDLKKETLEAFELPESDIESNRFNDGKIDALGRYWAGSMDKGCHLPSGALYRLDGDLSLHKMDDHYIITNGPAFSPDGTTMYHTDTIKRTIYAFDVRPDSTIGNKRTFVKLNSEDEGLPDGMTIDSQGCLWLCHYAGARITRYSPDADVLQVFHMPVPNITSCTFGGPQLDQLFITTARDGMSAEEIRQYPLAGSLFTCKPGVTGLPSPLFAG